MNNMSTALYNIIINIENIRNFAFKITDSGDKFALFQVNKTCKQLINRLSFT